MTREQAISTARHEMARRRIERAVVYQLPDSDEWSYGWDSGTHYQALRDEAAGLSNTGWSRGVLWLNSDGNHVGRE